MKKHLLNIDWVFLTRATLLVAFFCFLFVFLNTTDDFYNMAVMIIFTLTLTAAVAYWLWKGQKGALPLGWQMGSYVLMFLITALASIDPRRSLGELVFLFIAIFLFAFLVKLREWGWGADLILGAMLAAGSIIVLILWMQVAQWYLQWLDIAPGQWIPAITYRLPIPNVLAIFFNPLLMIVICKFFTASKWGWRFLYLLYGLAVAGLSFLASSRAAWLGAAAGLAFILFWVIRENRHRWLSFWMSLFQRKVILVLLTLVVLVVVGAGGYLLYQQTIHPTHGSLADARTEYWPPAWETFLEDPLTGQGPYTFISTWVQTYSVPPWGLFPHAHSTLFNLLAEEGILGLGAFLLLLASAFLLLWRRLKECEKEGQAAALAGMGALTALTVQGFFDCYHVETLGLWTVLILLGVGVGKRNEIEGKKRRPWWLIILPLALVWNLWTLDPLVKGIEAANGGDWQGAADQLTESVSRDPFQAIAHQQLGLVYANLAEAGNPIALPQAIAQFERTVELDPGWELNWLNLGAVYLSADQNGLALAALQKARELAPSSAVVMLNLGMAAEINGDETSAKQVYVQLLELKPDWIKAGFWRESELRMEVATSWKDEHPAGTEPSIETLEASVAANRAVALPYIRLAKAYLAAGRVEEAETNLQMAAIAYFWSEEERLEVYWWLAVIAHDRGDVEMAVQLAEPVFWGYQAQGIYGAGMYGNYIYAQIGFRRPAMGIDYVPQVRQTIYTDEWGWRMFTLSQWFEELGDYERAGEIQIRVLELIPDILQSRE